MINGMDHVTIVVSNLDASTKFYTEILGLRRTGKSHLEGEWIRAVLGMENVVADVAYLACNGGGARLELLEFKRPSGSSFPANSIPNTIGVRHIAFRVEDIASMIHRLKEAGVELLSEGVSVPKGVESGGSGQKNLCYFFDPDGALLELAEYL